MQNLLIAAALQEEVRELKDKLAADCTIHFKPAVLRRGLLFGREVGLLATGIGVKNTEKALGQVLMEFKPGAILFVGFAGGASPLAGVGTLVLAKKIIDAETGETFAGDLSLLDTAERVCKSAGIAHRVGGLATVKDLVGDPHEKANLGVLHESLALDMESAMVARIAQKNGIPLLVAKSIFDPLEMQLPNLQNCINAEGGAMPMMLMEHFVKQPSDMMKLPQLQYCVSQARTAITRFVEAWIKAS